jgi:hypothetical protein
MPSSQGVALLKKPRIEIQKQEGKSHSTSTLFLLSLLRSPFWFKAAMSSISGMAASIRAATGTYDLLKHSMQQWSRRTSHIRLPALQLSHFFIIALSCSDSETFDLAGQNVSTITHNIESAFREPLPLEGVMIRLTFVTGAGKQSRQKYDDGAAKAVTSTLRVLGYSEDHGASCVVECAGTFKLQHDTGKNLKTVVVFPIVLKANTDSQDGLSSASDRRTSLAPQESPEHLIATSSLNVFQRMLSSKCPSWTQKKGCLAALEGLKRKVSELENKLVKGQILGAQEQVFYDSAINLDDKEAHCKTEMHNQVERRQLTQFELSTLQSHNAERIEALKMDLSRATGKEVENAQSLLDKANVRKQFLSNIEPLEPHKLKHEQELRKLRKELSPLVELSSSSSKLRSIKETQSLARKEEIEEEIHALEQASRGWFEDDSFFQLRLDASRASFRPASSAKTKSSEAKVGAVSMTANTTAKVSKWVLPGETKKGGAWGSLSSDKKKKPNSGGAVFSAMMIDDDGDDEDDDAIDDDAIDTMKNVAAPFKETESSDGNVANVTTSVNTEGGGASKARKRKGRKKNGSRQSDEDFLNETIAKQTLASEKDTERSSQVVLYDIFRNYLIPGLAAIITWLVTLVLGRPEHRAQRR